MQKETHLTALGKTLSIFPLAPGYAKMLIMAKQHDLLAYVLCLVASLSVREPLISLQSVRYFFLYSVVSIDSIPCSLNYAPLAVSSVDAV